ncbi:helix-turn-helix domain-containing protein [Halorussus gelatinilyticus]|uniref:Helix-turn-helix domain-containing protein n=1 Tax=Halorussus gelatinilyticus TaxID=2937524 RepID=A0A8U0II35_9EURY|nr:helix-turn-helix domain-containing protein [Halorussus gelatinilyticus]UPW00673.1 helix-turn-helix domain-containing protein [Halorussus gelatinilyticus]
MKSLDVTIRLPPEMQLSVPERVAPGDAFEREELLSWHTHEDEGVEYFLSLVAGDIESLRAALAAVEEVRWFDLAPVDDDAFYAYVAMDLRPEDEAWRSAMDGRRVVVVPPIVFGPDGAVALTVLGDPEELRQVVADFPEQVEVEVERVSDHRRLAGSLAGRLTMRQFEAIGTARELGYYEVPREADLAAVADELDCTQSTASALLRKAERALVDAALVR